MEEEILANPTMEEEILANPDYQLVMSFLQSIRPGDMSPEAANQLIGIGQRIQGGGVLTDREREMFTAVVGNISQKQNSYDIDGKTVPMTPSARDSLVNSGQITQDKLNYQVDGQTVPMTQEQYGTEMQSGNITPDLPSMDGETYGPSSGVTVDPNVGNMGQVSDADIKMYMDNLPAPSNVMDMQQMIDAGIINPQRPQMRPTAPMTSQRPQMRPSAAPMTSPRPQMRPQNLGGR